MLPIIQARAGELEQRVIDISTPAHTLYGNHFSRDDLEHFLRPADNAVGDIVTWLVSQGVRGDKIVKGPRNWLSFESTLAQAESLLNAQFYYFHNEAANLTKIRALQYSVPGHLREHIQMIHPTVRFDVKRTQASRIISGGPFTPPSVVPISYNATFCNSTIIPACLRALYGMGAFPGSSRIKLGIAGFLDQYAKRTDLATFLGTYAPYANGSDFTAVSVNGGQDDQDSDMDSSEANLDVQYATSLSYKSQTAFYSTAGFGELVPDLDQPTLDSNRNEDYLDLLNYLVDLPDDQLPAVLSISYGEDEQSVPRGYANATCSLFAQLGGRGTSIILSSGDTGPGSACQWNNNTDLVNGMTRFLPMFPASCPFVTSVGATQHVEPEVAAAFSSGGFSDLFPRPAYQNAAVEGYLSQLGSRWGGLFNPNGRAFPDVSAQGVNFVVSEQGQWQTYQGTSCSAPTFAAIVANLNAIRIDIGQPPLGFLNPFIYSRGYQGFTDIVQGHSTGCTGFDVSSGLRTPHVPNAAWAAAVGWDPVTGFGTPRFPKLLMLMMQNQARPPFSRRDEES